ncbi:SigE family RNA polymerase sigma factor [Actinospica robiniae]|uniref:SigE family RNA polymerase sigma factor n=1 Tax=Actinospica robiniae TaxID=304901 RepID=UPI000426D94E|nr:SigE family RNA polymerase sigma factor [Actinospica robiniae]
MTRLAATDEEEFREFVTARAGQLFKVAYFIAGDYHDAQDLLQTSLAKLYVAWPRIERSQAAEAYARKVLLRTYLSQRRLKRSSEVPVDAHDLAGRKVDPGGDHDLQLSLAAALRQLPPRNRAVVVLHYLEGHDTATIADYLNTTPSAVKSLNTRSLRLLRAQLGESRDALFSPQNP